MRRNISSYGWALLIYCTLLSVSVSIAMVVSSVLELIPEILASGGYFDEEMVVSVVEESVSISGASMISAFSPGLR